MRILIVGAGDIGFQLSKRLFRERTDITIIEAHASRAQRAREQVDAFVVQGHGASARTLYEAGVARADLVAAMTDNDEVNLVACMIARNAGAATTIARVRNPEFLDPEYPVSSAAMGVDHFIHPEKETANTIVRLIKQASTTDIVEFENGKILLVGVRLEAGSPLLHAPIQQLWEQYGNPPMRIVAINRAQTTMIPRGNDSLIPGDHVFGVCSPEYVPTFVEHTGKKHAPVNDVMILGGGLVGQFVARALSQEKGVKVIESDVDKSREIAVKLPDTLVIQGDGTDIDLMAVEGLQDMDAFVAATGDDETNIISTLLAKHLKVPRTIALVNKMEYLPITPGIGMDAVVSKQLLTVNAVHRHILEKEVAAIASVPGIDAHIVEFIVQAADRIARKPLSEVNFPRNAIIGMVMRGEEYIVPRGDTRIQSGDRVIVFARPSALPDVEKLFR